MQHDDNAHLSDVDAERIFALTRPHPNFLKLQLIYAFLSNVGIILTILPLYFYYKTLRFRFDKDGVAVSHGLLFRKETYLTYARIQDIHVKRNIFERWLGIGTVEIQTASGSAAATESITGVTEYNEIRNFLYARMRGHRIDSHLPAGEKGVSSTGEFTEGTPIVDVMLAGIRDELRGARMALEDDRNV